MSDKPRIPDVLQEFRDYHACNPSWGSLHIVLDDGNVENSSVEFCRTYAEDAEDFWGARLATTLLLMSRTQRLKLARIA